MPAVAYVEVLHWITASFAEWFEPAAIGDSELNLSLVNEIFEVSILLLCEEVMNPHPVDIV